MDKSRALQKDLRFISSVAVVQAATLLFALACFQPHVLRSMIPGGLFVSAQVDGKNYTSKKTPSSKPKKITSGNPVRIVFPRLEIDLPVAKGIYNSNENSWSLEGFQAHHAEISQPANDLEGQTFIYGHNNRKVFGHLSSLKKGDKVHLFTENDLMFTYVYNNTNKTRPTDVSVFDYNGPPILTLQTCSGSFYEWRQFYKFSFRKVVSVSEGLADAGR